MESLLKLRVEENTVCANRKASGKAIKDVGQMLLNDILFYEYRGIIRKTERELSEVTRYDAASIKKLNGAFATRSKKLEIVWGNVLLLSEFLESYPFFKGIANALSEHKDKLSLAEDIEEVTSHNEWIKDFLKNKGRIDISWMALQAVEELLDGLPLFQGLSRKLSDQKNKLSQAQSIDETNQYVEWIQDVLKNRRSIDESWGDVHKLQSLLNNYSLFQGLSEALSEHKKRLSEAQSISEISEYRAWTLNVLKNKESITGSRKEIKGLQVFLDKHQFFIGIAGELTKRKNKLAEARNIGIIKEQHAWLNNLVTKLNAIISIGRNIRHFKKLSDEKKFGIKKKSVILLAQEAAEVSTPSGVTLINRKINKKRNLINSILLVAEKWNQIEKKKYFFKKNLFIKEQEKNSCLVRETIETSGKVAYGRLSFKAVDLKIKRNSDLADAILNLFKQWQKLCGLIYNSNINMLLPYRVDVCEKDLDRIKKHIVSLQREYNLTTGELNKIIKRIENKYSTVYDVKTAEYPFLDRRDFCCLCVPIPLAINLLSLIFMCPVLVIVRNYRINKMIKKSVFDW